MRLDIDSYFGEELATYLRSLNFTSTYIGLDNNDLSNRCETDLTQIANIIPKTVKSLSFCHTGLRQLNSNIFKNCPLFFLPNIEAMDYSQNNLGFKPITDLIALFSKFTQTLKTLRLGWNHLEQLKDNLPLLLKSAPDSLEDIHLVGNSLCNPKYVNLGSLLSALDRKNIRHIGLRKTELFKLDKKALKEGLANVPYGTVSLDLQENKLEEIYDENEIEEILDVLPSTVKRVILNKINTVIMPEITKNHFFQPFSSNATASDVSIYCLKS